MAARHLEIPGGRRHRSRLIMQREPPPGLQCPQDGCNDHLFSRPLPPLNKQVMDGKQRSRLCWSGCVSRPLGSWASPPRFSSPRREAITASPLHPPTCSSSHSCCRLTHCSILMSQKGQGDCLRGRDLGPLGSVSSPSVEHLLSDWHVLGSLVPETPCKLGR